MHRVALLTLPAFAVLVAADAPTAPLATDYGREIAWRVTTERGALVETTSSFVVDGVPQEPRGGGGGGGSTHARSLVHTDRVLAHADGAATKLRREYEEVAGSSSRAMRDETRETDLESPLDGVTLEFTIEGGERSVEVVDGDEPDAELLDRLRTDLALDALLPAGDVEVGEVWEVDAEALLRALGLDLDGALFPPPPRDEPAEGSRGGRGGRGFGGGGGSPFALLAGLEWEAEAELAEARVDTEFGPAARIVFEASASGGLPERGDGGGRGGATEGGVEAEVEGELLFLLEARHPASLEAEGRYTLESESTRERQDGGEVVIGRTEDGTWTVSVAIEAIADDAE